VVEGGYPRKKEQRRQAESEQSMIQQFSSRAVCRWV
jgi:hypothetical protein